jgi:hypothetical protein
LARLLWLRDISIRARVANPAAKENSAEGCLRRKNEQLAQSTFELKIEIGLKRRDPAGLILSPFSLIVQSPRVLLSRHISEIDQLLEKLEIVGQPAVVIWPSVPASSHYPSPGFAGRSSRKSSKKLWSLETQFPFALPKIIPLRSSWLESPGKTISPTFQENWKTKFSEIRLGSPTTTRSTPIGFYCAKIAQGKSA